jgi:HAD superfamily hydrolase (TIGR01549 family)
MTLRVVFFDAGNTLVFPNLELTLAPLISRGVRPSEEQLYASERYAKQQLDAAVTSGKSIDATYWQTFYSHLLGQHQIYDAELSSKLEALARTSTNWNRVLPGTRELLNRLQAKFRLGVISNADGRIEKLLADAGIGDCFESITDSGVVGYEKPHPQIFRSALKSLGVLAVESIYIGDIYSVDYIGAKAVGMQALLMDVSGTYVGSAAARVESLAECESRLNASEASIGLSSSK